MVGHRRWILLALAVSAVIFPSIPARTDVMPPGQQIASYCLEIIGTESFPDFSFFSAGDYPELPGYNPFTPLAAGRCLGVGRMRWPRVFAIRTRDLKPGQAFDPESPGVFRDNLDFSFRPPSGSLPLPDRIYVDKNSDVELVADVLAVESVANGVITLRRVHRRTRHRDGREEISKISLLDDRPWLPASAAAVVISLGAGLALRRRRHNIFPKVPPGTP
jgi:hypothetical protein